MTDEEIRGLEERRIPEELTARTIRQVKRLEKVVDVLPKPKWRPFGERCPRCGRKLRKSVALVQSVDVSMLLVPVYLLEVRAGALLRGRMWL